MPDITDGRDEPTNHTWSSRRTHYALETGSLAAGRSTEMRPWWGLALGQRSNMGRAVSQHSAVVWCGVVCGGSRSSASSANILHVYFLGFLILAGLARDKRLPGQLLHMLHCPPPRVGSWLKIAGGG